jgi:hypothetical protein
LQCSSANGVVFNGERLADSAVFIDTNRNFSLDAGEESTTSNFLGEFQFREQIAEGYVVALGGYGIDSGKEFLGSILVGEYANQSSKWLSHLSTLEILSGSPSKFAEVMAKNPSFSFDEELSESNLTTLNNQVAARLAEIAVRNPNLPKLEPHKIVLKELSAAN